MGRQELVRIIISRLNEALDSKSTDEAEKCVSDLLRDVENITLEEN